MHTHTHTRGRARADRRMNRQREAGGRGDRDRQRMMQITTYTNHTGGERLGCVRICHRIGYHLHSLEVKKHLFQMGRTSTVRFKGPPSQRNNGLFSM